MSLTPAWIIKYINEGSQIWKRENYSKPPGDTGVITPIQSQREIGLE